MEEVNKWKYAVQVLTKWENHKFIVYPWTEGATWATDTKCPLSAIEAAPVCIKIDTEAKQTYLCKHCLKTEERGLDPNPHPASLEHIFTHCNHPDIKTFNPKNEVCYEQIK